MPDNPRRISLILPVTAVVVVAIDRLTKWWVSSNIELGGSCPQTGFFRITHGENTGAAFGMMQDSRLLLTIISSVGVISILYVALVLSKRFSFLTWKTTVFALGLVLGGTMGNLIDRALVGRVTDFIKVWEWPDFNVADSSLVVGGIVLMFKLIRAYETEENNGSTNSAKSR